MASASTRAGCSSWAPYSVVTPVLGLLLFDVAVYWTHRWYHEVPLLWRFHAIHHSTKRLDWISGFRTHPLDGTLIAPAVIFLLAAGFSPEVAGVLAVVQIIIGIFLHANVRWRLRPLHRLVITPEFHHWHHANEPRAINSNYSAFLPAWDLVFGTYFMPVDRRPQRYAVRRVHPRGHDRAAPPSVSGSAAMAATRVVGDPAPLAIGADPGPPRTTQHPRPHPLERPPPRGQ